MPDAPTTRRSDRPNHAAQPHPAGERRSVECRKSLNGIVRQRLSELARGLEPLSACLQVTQFLTRDTRADLHQQVLVQGHCSRPDFASTLTPAEREAMMALSATGPAT